MSNGREYSNHRWLRCGVRWGACLFPIVVWALATMLLRGDLGRWNDDYAFNQRVPETGEAHQWHPYMGGIFTLSQQIWRPLFFVIIPTLQTALWDAPWANHTIQALLHLGLCALVWRLLLKVNVSRSAAASLTILYMTFPVHFQTLFWSACLTTILSTGIYVLLVLMYLRYSELPAGRGGSWGRVLGWTSGLVVVGTFIPLINEQPAAAVVALPFLHPALCLGRDPARGPRVWDLARAVLPIAVLLVVYAAYLYLYVSTSRKGYPATAGTFIDLRPRMFMSRMPSFLHEMWTCLTIGGNWDELFRQGVRAINDLGIEGAVWVGTAAATGSLWSWNRLGRRPRSSRGSDSQAIVGRGSSVGRAGPAALQVCVFGIVAFSSAWGVIYVLKVYQPEPRLFFMPLIGATAILGVLADAVLGRLGGASGSGRVVARVAGVVVVPVVIGWAVLLGGAQRIYREVYDRDEDFGAQLRALVPEAQRVGFFTLVRVEDPKYRVGQDWFNRQFHQIFLSSYNLSAWIKQQLRNSRAYGGTYDLGRTEYKVVDENALGWQWPFVPEGTPRIDGTPWNTDGVWLVPWDKVVPFKIDERGKIRLVTELAIQRADNRDGVVRPAMVAEIARNRVVPEEVATYYNTSADGRVVPVGPWKWAGGAIVPFWRQFEWDMEYTATRLIAGTAEGRPASRVFAVLPPSDRPTRVYFRACISRRDALRGQPDLDLRWTVGGAPEPSATLGLSSGIMVAAQRWIPVSFEVPPHALAQAIEVSVDYTNPGARPAGALGPGGGAGAPEVFAFVTDGFWEPVASVPPAAIAPDLRPETTR